MKLVSFLSVLLTALVPCMSASGQAAKPAARAVKNSKPNVIFILVDDMGWGDLDSNWSQQKLNGADGGQEERVQDPGFVRAGPGGKFNCAGIIPPLRSALRRAPPCAGGAPGNSRVVRNNRFDHPH